MQQPLSLPRKPSKTTVSRLSIPESDDTINLLHCTSVVQVSAYRVRTPKIAWINEGRFTKQLAQDNAFCVRQAYEALELYGTEKRIQFADRYGGHGLGYAGGSGRCATFGNVQIKGVGVTPLVSSKDELFHTSGVASLDEAAREAIWSQVFDSFLPYGAVPSLAITLTGGNFQERHANGKLIPRQRALLMREFALRPAHYLRNLRYVEPVESRLPSDALCQDANRSRIAINMLHVGLENAFGPSIVEASGVEKINLGLEIMVKRFAAQLATSFARRIFHGALSCSNIALDGRFMDFGVTSFVGAYRRRARGATWVDPWSEHAALLQTIQLLRFQVQKYLQVDGKESLISEAELVAVFMSELSNCHEVELLKMTGVPADVVMAYPATNRKRLYKSLRDIYTCGGGEAFISWPARSVTVGNNPAPRQSGRYDLSQILAVAATCTKIEALDCAVSELLSAPQLRRDFVDSYSDLREWTTSYLCPETRQTADVFIALQAIRLNADLSFLTLETLKDQLAAFDANPEGVGNFIDTTIRRGTYFLAESHPDLVEEGAANQMIALKRMGSALPVFVHESLSSAWVSQYARDRLTTLTKTPLNAVSKSGDLMQSKGFCKPCNTA